MINQDFVTLINSGHSWAFVGSGPSVDAGLASWANATLRTAERIEDGAKKASLINNRRWRKALQEERFPVALQAAEEILGREELLRAFAGALGRPSGAGQIYPLLARWPFRNFVTTNYDSLLCESIRPLEPTISPVENAEGTLPLMTREPENVVLRLHGNLSPGTTSILTEADYDTEYGPNGRIGGMAVQLLRDRRFVFIGFGFNDPDLNRLIRLTARVSNPARPHFAFLGFRKEDPERYKDLATEYRLVVIPYRIASDGTHGDLRRVLLGYDWCILSRATRRAVPHRVVGRQSAAVGALQIANECLATGQTDQPRIRQVLRTISLAALRDGPKDPANIVSLVPRILPLQDPRALPVAALVEEELRQLERLGSVRVSEGLYELTEEGKVRADGAGREGELLKHQFTASVKARVSATLPSEFEAEEAARCVVNYLNDSCIRRAVALGQLVIAERPIAAELQRINVLSEFPRATEGLSSADVALAAIAAVGDILSSPSEVEKRYLGRLIQASFASQLIGLEPESLRVRREDVGRTIFLTDSNVLAPFLARESLGHQTVKRLFEILRALGSKLAVTPRLLQEAADHGDWARHMFVKYGPVGPQILDILAARNGFRPNLFVAGYVSSRDKRPGLLWQRYLQECFGLSQPVGRITEEIVRRYCERFTDLQVFDPARDQDNQTDFFARRESSFETIKSRRHRRGTYRNDEQVLTEAEVVVLVERLTNTEDALGQRAFFVSNTRVLDGLPGFPARVTIEPDGLGHWLSALRPSGVDEAVAFESMVYSLYQEGIALFDRASFCRVFEPLVSSTEERFGEALAQHRTLLEEIVGPNPERAFAEVDDLSKPLVLRGIEGRLADAMRTELEQEKKLRLAAEEVSKLRESERKQFERLKAEKAERRARAQRKKRAAASRPGRRRKR